MERSKKIPEAVYEELKEAALLRQPCTLQFRAGNGGLSTLHTTITNVFEDEDGQYLLATNGLTLQLHQLVSINGKPLEHFC